MVCATATAGRWEVGNYDVFVAKNDYPAMLRQVKMVASEFAPFAHPQSGEYGNPVGSTAFSPTAGSDLVGVPLRSGLAPTTSMLYNNLVARY